MLPFKIPLPWQSIRAGPRTTHEGVAERRSRTKGWKGGVRPKAKKKVTSPILIAEVVVDVPKGTSDGSTGVQVVFELL